MDVPGHRKFIRNMLAGMAEWTWCFWLWPPTRLYAPTRSTSASAACWVRRAWWPSPKSNRVDKPRLGSRHGRKVRARRRGPSWRKRPWPRLRPHRRGGWKADRRSGPAGGGCGKSGRGQAAWPWTGFLPGPFSVVPGTLAEGAVAWGLVCLYPARKRAGSGAFSTTLFSGAARAGQRAAPQSGGCGARRGVGQGDTVAAPGSRPP